MNAIATAQGEDVEKLAGMIKDIKIAMLTTAERDGTLRSRPMATQATPFDGTLWFFTQIDSGKVGEVMRDQRVNVSYADARKNSFVSVSGTAQIVMDKEKAKELWNPLYKAWFPKGLEDPELALMEVRVTEAEYWDAPHSKVVLLAGFVKALVTGKQFDEGEHKRVGM